MKQQFLTILILAIGFCYAMEERQILAASDYSVKTFATLGDPEILGDPNSTPEERKEFGPRGPLPQFESARTLSNLEAIALGAAMQNKVTKPVPVIMQGDLSRVETVLGSCRMSFGLKEDKDLELNVAPLGNAVLGSDVQAHYLIGEKSCRYKGSSYSWAQVLGLMIMGSHLPFSSKIALGNMPNIYSSANSAEGNGSFLPSLNFSQEDSGIILTWNNE
jgi:hypothetical protein